jgi:hypothetical protein
MEMLSTALELNVEVLKKAVELVRSGDKISARELKALGDIAKGVLPKTASGEEFRVPGIEGPVNFARKGLAERALTAGIEGAAEALDAEFSIPEPRSEFQEVF